MKLERLSEVLNENDARGMILEGIDHARWRVRESSMFATLANRYLRLTKRSIDVDPLCVVWIDPSEIKYVAGGLEPDSSDSYHFQRPSFESRGRNGIGAVIGGDWDLTSAEFTDLEEYDMLKAHFVDRLPWEDTSFYKRHINEANLPSEVGTWPKQKLRKRLSRVDSLYHQIEDNGILSQASLGGYLLDEIIVYVGRHGDYYWNENGRHRLAIAKILDLEEVPVLMTIRHSGYIYPNYRQ